MADNYLEQRMEDLRSGKLRSSLAGASHPGSRKGYLHTPFPSRRVLITGGLSEPGLSIARAYLKAGCKVAIFDNNQELGEKMAHDEGIRFHNVILSDADSVEAAFTNLLKAWRDVDIIIYSSGNLSELIPSLWIRHRDRYPIPTDFGGRLIAISSGINYISDEIMCKLNNKKISTHIISHNNNDDSVYQSVANCCIFISTPGNNRIKIIQIQ